MDNVLCKVCGKFVSKANYARHHKSHFEEVKFACYQCAKSFKRKDKLEDHLRTHRKPEEIRCSECSSRFIREKKGLMNAMFRLEQEYEHAHKI